MIEQAPDKADLGVLSGLAPELASTFVKVASDIALVVGSDGVIRNVVEGATAVRGEDGWVGRAWADTVTPDTRRKVELLLDEARSAGVSRRREVNHVGAGGAAIPVSWAAVRLGENGPVLAVGRDLRSVAAIQQRFLDAQQEMERDYWQRRHGETRYRLLFQVARDAVLVVDALDFTVVDANPAAQALFGGLPLAGRPLDGLVDAGSRSAVGELLLTARATGRPAEARVRSSAGGSSVTLSAVPLRADGRSCLLVRTRALEPAAGFFEHMPEAAVVTDSAGRIRLANPSFVALARVTDEARLRGLPIGDVLGDADHTWPALLAQVRRHGLVGSRTVRVEVAGATPLDADVSGSLLADSDQEDIGFTIRTHALPSAADMLTAGVAEIASRLGQVPLPQLLAQTVQWAERHFIEAALARCGGRAEPAAALLGIDPAGLAARLAQLDLPPRPLPN
jgi:transcriptional regulator PpsR